MFPKQDCSSYDHTILVMSRSLDCRYPLSRLLCRTKKLFFSSDSPNAEGLSSLKPHANLPFLLESGEGRKRPQGQAFTMAYRKVLKKLQKNITIVNKIETC